MCDMPVCCHICEKTFSRKSNLNRHLRESHLLDKKSIVSVERKVPSFKCNECNSSFANNNDLREHLDDEHGFKTNSMEIFQFPSYEEFQIWLKQEEYDETIEYFKASTYTSVKSGEEYKTTYFSCNRSGKIVEKKDKSKITKIHGSCKLNSFCTSQIIVQRNLSTGLVTAKYYYVHYGHDNSIDHVRLPKLVKEKVVEQLLTGVSPSRILMDERNYVGADSKLVQRKELLTRKHINNIKVSYNIHQNSANGNVKDTSQNLVNSFQTEECEEECSIEATKQQIRNDISTIVTNLEHETSLEKLDMVLQHVEIANQILDIDENFETCSSPTRLATVREPSNKKISKKNTKKKRLKNTGNCNRLNVEEKNMLLNSLHDHNYFLMLL